MEVVRGAGLAAIGVVVLTALPLAQRAPVRTPGGSAVSWSCDTPIVASSGDLGVSIGFIRANAPGPDGRLLPPTPFFTIWRKVNGSWKYIAE